MEPFRKRQRLYPPVYHEFPHAYDDQPTYYDELGESEDYDAEELEDDEPVSDPDAELEQRRARLDFRLKSTFESIFEKYGKDFEGVGDEIDLATGEFVVNNGHLIEMRDERDAGNSREDTTEPEEGFSSSVVDEDLEDEDDIEGDEEEDEDSEDAEDALSEDDVMDDDIVLRGFAKATQQYKQPEPEMERLPAPSRPRHDIPRSRISGPNMPPKVLPSREEILAQFGPQLGPGVIEYVSNQNVDDEPTIEPAWSIPNLLAPILRRRENNVEPAWRVPEFPTSAPRKRPILKTIILQPEEERSPSPDTAISLWAPAGQHKPKQPKFTNDRLLARDTSAFYPSYAPVFSHLGLEAALDAGGAQVPRKRRGRHPFTPEEDRTMLEWISRVRKHSKKIPASLWDELEAKYPHHTADSWKSRHSRQYTYLEPEVVEDSEVSTTETSEDAYPFLGPHNSRPSRPEKTDHTLAQVAQYQRPVRVRKPAQRDSKILSWTEAVDTIKSLDPELHAGMRADARHNLDEGTSVFDRHRSLSNQNVESRRISDHRQDFRKSNPDRGEGRLLQQSRHDFSDLPDVTRMQISRRQDLPNAVGRDNDDASTTSAPCPHADCRLYTIKSYRLQRMANEEQSQMSLHLHNVHHTTPYPCGEIGCPQKGEDGYFMQTELVRHVKSAHPNVGALHRLRGRVDSNLLEKSSWLGKPLEFQPNTSSSSHRPASQYKDSDFMSQQRRYSNGAASSSRPFSGSSDLDRTPRGTTAASTHTRMTSVSSLMVNHASAKASSMLGIGDSQDRSSMCTSDMQNENHGHEHTSNPTSYSTSFMGANEGDDRMQWHTAASPELGTAARNASERFRSTSDLPAEISGRGTENASHTRTHRELVSPPVSRDPSPRPRSRPSLPASIPNSQSLAGDRPSSSGFPRTFDSSASNTMNPPKKSNEAVNGSAYLSKDVPSMLAPPNKPRRAAAPPPFVTPAKKRKPRKSAASNIFDLDDADELSMGSAGFVLLSSRRTAKAPFELPVRIKRDDTAGPGSNPISRKRKLYDFEGSDDIDELMADEPDFSISRFPSSKTPKIKTEEQPTHTLFKHVKPRKQSLPRRKSTLSHATFPTSKEKGKEVIRASTPLLNLTPKRARAPEIAGLLLTPQKKGPAIVVKTPGGTLRRCGEDGFQCRRSFCFRCGVNGAV